MPPSPPPPPPSGNPPELAVKSADAVDAGDAGKTTQRLDPALQESRNSAPPASEGRSAAPREKRRFKPEVVEQTRASTRDRRQAAATATATKTKTKTTRKFEPVVLETTSGTRGPRRFEPVVVETTTGSTRSRRGAADTTKETRRFKPEPLEHTRTSTRTSTTARRARVTFQPRARLVNTGFETRRNGGEGREGAGKRLRPGGEAASLADDDGVAHNLAAHDPLRPRPRSLSPLDGSPGLRPACLLTPRQHSYHTPALDPIASSGSGGSDAESHLSAPSSASPTSPPSPSKAQRQLENQALAAFPNPDFGYSPPRHYAAPEDGASPCPSDSDSDSESHWPRREMQRHAELLRQERNANRPTAPRASRASRARSARAPGSAAEGFSPPLLGAALAFPRCASPRPARFDVTQSPRTLRAQLCRRSRPPSRAGSPPALWRPPAGTTNPTNPTAARPDPTPPAPSLWHGLCTPSARPARPRRRRRRRLDPAAVDAHIAANYPDSFVSQVYAYLDLARPAQARPFDAELAAVAGVQVRCLRVGDWDWKGGRGWRGAWRRGAGDGDGDGDGEPDATPTCPRWHALRTYVRVWARRELLCGGWDGYGYDDDDEGEDDDDDADDDDERGLCCDGYDDYGYDCDGYDELLATDAPPAPAEEISRWGAATGSARRGSWGV